MDVKQILAKIGLGAAASGAIALNTATGGVTGPLVTPIVNAIAAKLDPAVRNQYDLAVQAAADDLTKTELDSAQKIITAVNETMQSEVSSPRWYDHWRAGIGWVAATVLVNNYVLLPWFHNHGLEPIVVPPEGWLFISAVLGITAWHSGAVDQINAKNGNGN